MASVPPKHIFTPDTIKRLENEYDVLHLIYHRNRNQHHVAAWWKHLTQLHSSVRKIICCVYDFDAVKKYSTKLKLYTQALSIARSMVKRRLFTKCYYSFNGVIALGQFISMGMTLVASLSALHSLITSLEGLSDNLKPTNMKPELVKNSLQPSKKDADDDLGEEILCHDERGLQESTLSQQAALASSNSLFMAASTDAQSMFFEKPRKKKRKEKKEKSSKEKKKRSIMDDIFG